MKKDDNYDGCALAVSEFVGDIIAFILCDTFHFAVGLIAGWVLAKMFGSGICDVLPITKGEIPVWCGVIHMVGYHMRTKNKN